MNRFIFFLLFIMPVVATAQLPTDSLMPLQQAKRDVPVIIFERPKPFSFITNIPSDAGGYIKQSFARKNLYKISIVAGSTLLLYLLDQHITDGFQRLCQQVSINGEQRYTALITIKLGGKETTIGKIPQNINTAFYNIGQGSTSMLLAAGFLIGGKIKKDNRALQTASQLTQAFITLGAGTQLMKYATGRETPSSASQARGTWRPFPSIEDFQSDKSRYDAFPSGHLATFVSMVTIIGENYPEKKWIKPVGYGLSALCSLAMINNGVHWASDYPLGFALGYGMGKFISKKHQHFNKPSL